MTHRGARLGLPTRVRHIVGWISDPLADSLAMFASSIESPIFMSGDFIDLGDSTEPLLYHHIFYTSQIYGQHVNM